MSRGLHADTVAEIAKNQVRPVLFFEIVTEVDTVRFHSGVGDLAWNSLTWTGVGEFLGLSQVEESSALAANGLTITLSGVPASVTGGYDLGDMMNQLAPNNDVTVWLGFLEEDLTTVVANPFEWFKGFTSHATLSDSGEASTVTLHCEHELIKFQTAVESRCNSEEQKRRFAGDLFFDFLPRLPLKEIIWGQGPPLQSGGAAGIDSSARDSGARKAPRGR